MANFPNNPLCSVIKRNGLSAPFDESKIRAAILRAGQASQEFDDTEAGLLSSQVIKVLSHKFQSTHPAIENIQDVVEQVLISANHFQTARSYIVIASSTRNCGRIATPWWMWRPL